MQALLYIFRLLYRRRYWLLICPLIIAYLSFHSARKISYSFEVKTTIYTGVVSGFDIESGGRETSDWNTMNNAMDNLSNIITAQTTLKRVSMRLYAQHMMYGDLNKDNNYITADHFRAIYNITPPDVRKLIDKTSEEKTLENLYAYEKANNKNFVYGLFNFEHRHYSYGALSKILVRRLGNSDMLEVKYSNDDPGITYNTLVILNDEFVKQYEDLRFGETNSVIKYFEEELARVGHLLRIAEDSLTDYNVEKRVINYDEQTKHIASLSRDFELRFEDILLAYHGSDNLIKQLEEKIDEHVKNLKDNALFVQKLKTISDLTTRLSTIESFQPDSLGRRSPQNDAIRKDLTTAEEDLTAFVNDMSRRQYTKEGVSSVTFVNQWVTELIRFEKAKAEKDVMVKRKEELDKQYTYYSPVGSTIKRKEREINFTEQSYLSILQSLNAARLKQKNLQMTSATLKIVNPPIFPIATMPTKRKFMVAAAYFGTLFFLIGCFILIELFDRTLQDKTRAERITGGKVLGAFAKKSRRYRAYNQRYTEIASQYLGNSLLPYFKQQKPDVINILSTSPGDGKSFMAEELASYLKLLGMTVKVVSWHEDFSTMSKEYYSAQSIKDLYQVTEEEVLIVEYPSLQEAAIPGVLLQEASINLLATRANRVWKDTDQILYDKLIMQVDGKTPVFLYLTQADPIVVETFTGLLPPYSFTRKLGYRFYQFGLTSVDK